MLVYTTMAVLSQLSLTPDHGSSRSLISAPEAIS